MNDTNSHDIKRVISSNAVNCWTREDNFRTAWSGCAVVWQLWGGTEDNGSGTAQPEALAFSNSGEQRGIGDGRQHGMQS